jgi:hypothetical protein
MMYGQHREDGLHRTSRAKQMSNGTLGTAHINLGGIVLASFAEQEPFDGIVLCCITQSSRSGMCVDIVDLPGLDFCVLQGLSHG